MEPDVIEVDCLSHRLHVAGCVESQGASRNLHPEHISLICVASMPRALLPKHVDYLAGMPASRRILVVCGHPTPGSLCEAIARAYGAGSAAGGHVCRTLVLHELTFDPILHGGYHSRTELEPSLVAAQEAILWAEHLVFVYPTWWGSMPALLKGLIDRTFLPGFAFKYRENSMRWDRLLAGRSARLIVTMDAPWWWDTIVNRSTSRRTMAGPILKFCGVRPVRVTVFDQVKGASEEKRKGWLGKAQALGAAGG